MRHPFLRRQSCLVCLLALTSSTFGLAAPTLVKKVDQKGDFALIGNTLGWDCDNTPAANYMPADHATAVSTLCATATNTADSAIDIYWSDNGAATPAVSATGNTAEARSTAVLTLQAGDVVTYARLYWAAFQPQTGAVDSSVTLDRPGNNNVLNVAAQQTWTAPTGNGNAFWYQGAAEVTDWVANMGTGAFRVSGVAGITNVLSSNVSNVMAGWSLVVFYTRPGDQPRNLALFEGLDSVNAADAATSTQTVTLDGFLVPAAFDAKLGVVAYEGDFDANGDSLSMGPDVDGLQTLTNAQNPANNFFNSSRSYLGAAVSNAGDMPQLTGAPRTMSGIDIDVVDVKSVMTAGQTQATIRASSTSERYALATFVTSIATFKPDFSSSGKTVLDKDGAPLRPNDTLVYTVTASNTGSDTSTETVVKDVLPTQVTYVPGSLVRVPTSGEPVVISDDAGDDTGEYDPGTRTLTVRLGTGANETTGGTMAVGDSVTLRFEVTLNADATGLIENQAIVTAGGVQGALPSDYFTDGNNEADGSQPTQIGVDTDGDGLPDVTEVALQTDPNDADSDDDGVLDGAEPSPELDTDGDGLINALDPDSDNDGLFDGTELGLGCDNAATSVAARSCRPDADAGATKTNPLLADTDGGGVRDGSEDANLNGMVDTGETNPIVGQQSDDATVADTDGDGLSNGLEATLGSNPNDKDSDDDGVLDGLEPNPSEDGDFDGLVDVIDPDSDNDGLFDGTEMSFGCSDPATDPLAMHCVADADPATHTSAVMADTDRGGVIDGSEDVNGNGRIDRDSSDVPTETDPNVRADDINALNADADGDGLSDAMEAALGSNPNDKDSDDDGVPDGAEHNPSADSDRDGLRNVMDPDSDGDGLYDGTELGYLCDGEGTAASSPTCIADADRTTTTSMVDIDTDNGGLTDGTEDTNKNGAIDTGERNPNDPSDDASCLLDVECNPSTASGRVCSAARTCIDGCRGIGGNGCPIGQICSSTTIDIGTCSVGPSGAGGAAGAGGVTTSVVPSVAGTAGVMATGGVSAGGVTAVAGATTGLPAAGATTTPAGGTGATSAIGGGTTTAAGGQSTGGTGVVATTGTGPQAAGGSPGSAGDPGDSLEGGGCDCNVAGETKSGHAWLLALAAGLLLQRRKRSR